MAFLQAILGSYFLQWIFILYLEIDITSDLKAVLVIYDLGKLLTSSLR